MCCCSQILDWEFQGENFAEIWEKHVRDALKGGDLDPIGYSSMWGYKLVS